MCGRANLNIRLAICVVVPALAGHFTTVRGQALCDYPPDNAVITGNTMTYLEDDYIWTTLVFVPGANAFEHVYYFNEDYSKVESRAQDANLGPPPYGSTPGWEYVLYVSHPLIDPVDESLVRGTKYYWTVDETDDQGQVWAGDIWEFTILGFYAFAPSPRNEAAFVSEDVLLSWLPGFVPDVSYLDHDIYVGTSWEDVNNAVYDVFNQPPEFVDSRSEPNYQCSGLARDTKFYWRVDEVYGRLNIPPFGGGVYYKGDVWEFTTGAPGVFVDIDATGINDGSTWADAFNHLQDALTAVAVSGKEIWAAEGTYTPDQGGGKTAGERAATFQLINRVAIYGGYAGWGEPDPNARDIDAYPTILSGDLSGNDSDITNPADLLTHPSRSENSYHVVTGSGTGERTILDGFTITGGFANHADYPHRAGGGLLCEAGNLTVQDCAFQWNWGQYGGALYSKNSSGLTVTDCTFVYNGAGSGGAMHNTSGTAVLSGCQFEGNYAAGGAAIRNYESSPSIDRCVFRGNGHGEAYRGGALHNQNSSSPVITNSIFVGNAAHLGGAIDNIFDSRPIIINCTIYGNSATTTPLGDYLGDGGAMFSGNTATMTNCIVWGNTSTGDGAQFGYVQPDANYSCLQSLDSVGGVGNISNDPLFTDGAGGNFRLAGGSPCIDVGDNNSVPADVADLDNDSNTDQPIPFDLDGRGRIVDGDCNDTDIVDMGAYEFAWVYIGDFDGQSDVDLGDFGIFGLAWLTEEGQGSYNPVCDISIPADNKVDWRDVKILCDNWLSGH